MSKQNKNHKESVENIIKNSGHKLHLRVVALLENEGWKVEISPYYIDDLTNIPREIDIIAKKTFYYKSRADNEQKTFYFLLGIDCKYLTQNVVIWGRENQLKARALFTNIDSYFRPMLNDQNSWSSWCAYSRFLHVGRLAQEGWGSQALQGGMLQAIKATLDRFNRGMDGPTIFFPAVVYELDKDINIYSIGDGVIHSKDPQPLKGNWIYHIDYAYTENNKHRQRQFYIDLINEKTLIDFLQMLEKDGQEIAQNFHFHSK